jgi:hypothetical protein
MKSNIERFFLIIEQVISPCMLSFLKVIRSKLSGDTFSFDTVSEAAEVDGKIRFDNEN